MSEQKPFPLNLTQVSFMKLSFEAIQEFDPSSIAEFKLTPINNIAVQENPHEKNSFVMQMTTLINPEKSKDQPYFIDIVVLAYFSYLEGMDIEEARRGVTITGHNVCYGAIREAVGWITGRLPYGPIGLGLSVLQPTQPAREEN